VAFAHTGISVLIGTSDPTGAPDCVRGTGVRIWPGACQLTLLMPQVTGATSIANLRANPKCAVALSEILTARTMQLKGTVLAIREGSAEDRAHAKHYVEMFSDQLAVIGQPSELTRRFGYWPLWAIDLEIEAVYAQTPGPVAGAKMPDVVGTI
jgi:hypothetical protein